MFTHLIIISGKKSRPPWLKVFHFFHFSGGFCLWHKAGSISVDDLYVYCLDHENKDGFWSRDRLHPPNELLTFEYQGWIQQQNYWHWHQQPAPESISHLPLDAKIQVVVGSLLLVPWCNDCQCPCPLQVSFDPQMKEAVESLQITASRCLGKVGPVELR